MVMFENFKNIEVTDLGQIVAGNISVRQSEEDIIFFNPIGMGIHKTTLPAF